MNGLMGKSFTHSQAQFLYLLKGERIPALRSEILHFYYTLFLAHSRPSVFQNHTNSELEVALVDF